MVWVIHESIGGFLFTFQTGGVVSLKWLIDAGLEGVFFAGVKASVRSALKSELA